MSVRLRAGRQRSKRSRSVLLSPYPASLRWAEHQRWLVKAPDVLRFPGEWHERFEAEFMRLYSRSNGSLPAETWNGSILPFAK